MRRLARFVATGLVALVALAPIAARADHEHYFQTPGFNSSTAYGDPVTLSARLLETDDDDHCPPNPCPARGSQVDFYVDGEYAGTDVTNSGGYAYLLITSAQKWHVGSHTVRAQYDRTGAPATVTSTLTIVKETTILSAREGYYEARLLDDDNVPVTGQAVTFSLGGLETCTAFTDFDGNARCIPMTGAGLSPLNAVQYEARFVGTGDYLESTATANLL